MLYQFPTASRKNQVFVLHVCKTTSGYDSVCFWDLFNIMLTLFLYLTSSHPTSLHFHPNTWTTNTSESDCMAMKETDILKNPEVVLFYSTNNSILPELSSRFSEQLRIFKQTFTSFTASFDAGSVPLLDFKILASLLLSAPTDDELHLACEMKTAKPLIPSKRSRSSASA